MARFFRGLRLMGAFQFVLPVALLIIVLTVVSTFNFTNSIDDLVIIHRERERYQIAHDITIEMRYEERGYLIVESADRADISSYHGELLDEYNALLDEIDSEQGYEFVNAYLDPRPRLEGYRDTITSNFDHVTEGVDNDTLTLSELEAIIASEADIDPGFDDILLTTTARFNQQTKEINGQRQGAIMRSLVGLIIFPVLAMLTFAHISRLTRPLLDLTNSITAIKGRNYHPETLADVRRRRDGLGQMVAILDAVAESAENRKAALQKQVDDLEAELVALRHEKMEQLDQRGAAR